MTPSGELIQKIANERVEMLFVALLFGGRVTVKTTTRQFSGNVFELRRSPFTNHIGATVVDDEGRVHNFFVTKTDCSVKTVSRDAQ